jgi:hypothetical protein
MADAQRSERCHLRVVEVQVLSSALKKAAQVRAAFCLS